MGTFFVYILKSAFCMAGFYLFYRLLLSRETFHRFNRIALLGILLLSLCIPFVQFTTNQHTEMHQTMLTIEQLLMMADTTAVVPQEQEITVSGIQIAIMLYLAGIAFFAVRNLYALGSLLLLVRSGRKEQIEGKITLVIHARDIAPFSWMKYIVISQKDLEENGREILIHERAHIRNRHSVDLSLADICIFFQWFNPASWLLKQELQNIHEYEADETVIKEGVNAKEYQLLLIKKAVGTRLYSMANSFNHSKLKKRITMMIKEKSNPWARLKYAYVLPLAAIAVTAFARPEFSNKMEEISAVKVNDLKVIVETKVLENQVVSETHAVAEQIAMPETSLAVVQDTVKKEKPSVGEEVVFEVVEEMPEYPGGLSAFKEFLARNIKYPKAAFEAKVEGRVIVQFIINKDGSISAPRVVHSVSPELDSEALRVVKSMPKWKPGKQRGQAVPVKFTAPITFYLPGITGSSAGSVEIKLEDKTTVKPLVLIDGKEVDAAILQALDPNKIKSVSVLKDKSATEVYGEKGKNGVILVDLKDTPAVIGILNSGLKVIGSQIQDGMKVIGMVKDEFGKPVIGANVIIEGTTNGTITDMDGRFILNTPKDKTIAVSYIGMKTVKVSPAAEVTVKMVKE